MPFDRFPADADRDGEADHRHRREGLGADGPIPAKTRRSARAVVTTPLRREMARRLAANPGVETDRAAHRRKWRVETVASVAKRRCGEALTARLDDTQRLQAPVRGVAYDV